MRQKILA